MADALSETLQNVKTELEENAETPKLDRLCATASPASKRRNWQGGRLIGAGLAHFAATPSEDAARMTDGALAQHAASAGRILLEACKLHQKPGSKSALESHQSELDHSVSIGRGGALSSLVVSSSATLGTPPHSGDETARALLARRLREIRAKRAAAASDLLAESVGISGLVMFASDGHRQRARLSASGDALHRRGCWASTARLGSAAHQGHQANRQY